MLKALNDQIREELYSSYLYLSMSAYFEASNWKGFAHWMKVQSEEEKGHAMRIYNHIIERRGRVTLQGIEAPPTAWKSPLDAFEAAYEHETKITRMINALADLAAKSDDKPAQIFLQWFVNEQVEEESSADDVVQKLKLIKDSANGLFMLDHALGQRKGG
jgi:ferritin